MIRTGTSALPKFLTPAAMYQNILARTVTLEKGECVRNYTGTIQDMKTKNLAIPTDLFTPECLDFYSRHNLDLVSPETHKDLYDTHYTAARGGAQGDYRKGILPKIDNLVDCLHKFPGSKRAVLTVPDSGVVDHTNTGESKCLRELHFYREKEQLHCSGFMRAQAATIFPKNIHYIGTLMGHVAGQLDVEVGEYTHFVTTLVNER